MPTSARSTQWCALLEGKSWPTSWGGRFENLRNDFARVAEEIGAPGLALPHLLRSKIRQSRHYRDFYDERLKKLVYERYEKDVETFEYSF